MRRGRGRRLALFLCLFPLLLAACGSAASDSEKASQGNGGADPGQADVEKAHLDFARCMREHGVDMPDPQAAGNGVMRFEAPEGGASSPEERTFQEAEKACRHLLGDAGPQQLKPEDQKAMQDAMLAFARCMRENGIDMPDPQPGGGIVARKGEAPDFDSPQFKAAEKECRKHTEAMDKKLGIERSEG